MRSDDPRHRVKVGNIVSYRTEHRWDIDMPIRVTEIGLVVSWSGDGFVANVIFKNGIRQVHVRKLKVINENW